MQMRQVTEEDQALPALTDRYCQIKLNPALETIGDDASDGRTILTDSIHLRRDATAAQRQEKAS